MSFIGLIPPESFSLFNGQAEKLLDDSIAYCLGEYQLQDVLFELEDRETFAAGEVADDGALVSLITLKVLEFPRLRSLLVQFGAGRNVKHLLPFVLEFARQQRCARIETRCREAVAKLYRRHGFSVLCEPFLNLEV